MGLIIFEGLFIIVLGVMMTFLFTRKDSYGNYLAVISLSSTLTVAFLTATYILLYFEMPELYTQIMSKLMFSGVVFISSTMVYLSLKAPYFTKNVWAAVLPVLVFVSGIAFVVLYLTGIQWNSLTGFSILSADLPFIKMNSIDFFYLLHFLGMPLLSALILFIRSFSVRSNIYKQQLVLTSILFLVVGVTLYGVALASKLMFSWMFAFFPLPYIVMILFSAYIFSLGIVFDRKEILFSFLRFLVFTVLFAAIAGAFSGYALSHIRNFQSQIVFIVLSVASVLLVRHVVKDNLHWLFGDTSEYAKPFEKALQEIDYETGRGDVIHEFVSAVKQYIKAYGVDILISDDAGTLDTIFSSQDNIHTYNLDTPAFDYVINENIQVLLHTELIASYKYAEIREELSEIFKKTGSDVMVFIKDGQKIIAVFALSPKIRHEEYNIYDVELIKKLYSYFFLVAYYLKNIAKQDILITVDREIEMSDQIISSIQDSMDKIQDQHISVDSIAYSAYKLGGDFIDFIKLSETRHFFLIGDVAGKGLSASMSMIILKSILRTFLAESQDFKELVVKINSFVKVNLPKGTFFAGLFGIIDFKTNTIYYLNCGIPLMSMYINNYKNSIEVQGEGRVLGFVKNIKPFLKVRKIVMNPNDIIVFTTDGLLESTNLRNDRFGKDRVGRLLTDNSSLTSKEIADTIYHSLEDFVPKELQDDVTILVFKHNG